MNIIDRDMVTKVMVEIEARYSQIARHMEGLTQEIYDLEKVTRRISDSGEFEITLDKCSSELWRRKVSEMIRELTRVEKKKYPTPNSVLASIYIELKNDYGVVFDQLRKEFKHKNNTMRSPSAFEAISDNETIREIFEALLNDKFPDVYFEDEVLSMIENAAEEESVESSAEVTATACSKIQDLIVPLARKRKDDSFGYADTFNAVCGQMDCSWGNLKKRYMNKHGCDTPPSEQTIIENNYNVYRKFKNTIRAMLEEYTNI